MRLRFSEAMAACLGRQHPSESMDKQTNRPHANGNDGAAPGAGRLYPICFVEGWQIMMSFRCVLFVS